MNNRIAITGMAINTPLGDTKEEYLNNLLAGKSAITSWQTFDTERVYGKVGGDLKSYNWDGKLAFLEKKAPEEVISLVHKFIKKIPRGQALSVLVAVDAFVDSGLFANHTPDNNIPTIVAGHNTSPMYSYSQRPTFDDEPDFIDGLFALYGLDTNHAGLITETLKLKGAAYTIGGACASGNMALRAAIDEIRYHEAPAAMIAAPIFEFSPMEMHGMALLDAITYKSFNDTPELASRPYDTRREGFVPSHGCAAIMVEDLNLAKARGAKIYAEVLGAENSSDGNHLPQPSAQGQAKLAKRLLKKCNVAPEQIDYVSAHATSTPLGDLTELKSIKEVFGSHAQNLKINAPKSMLGHTCWSAATVELVAAILQMEAGRLHPSINIDNLDPQVDVDVCKDGAVDHQINLMLKNSFGFGGLNSISLIKRYQGE